VNSWTTISTDSSSPYSVSWDTTAVSDGQYDLRVITTDNAGNPFTSGLVTVRIDNTNPTPAALTLPASIKNGQSLTDAATDGGSGVASVQYLYCQGSSCTPNTSIGSSSTGPNYSVTWNSQPADNSTYRVLARVTDSAGNTADSGIAATTIDN